MSTSRARLRTTYAPQGVNALILALLLVSHSAACAQDSAPAPELRMALGYTKVFLDEPGQFVTGASLRVHVTRRFGIEPEVLFTRGADYEQWSFIPNFVYALRDPREKVTPYLIGGIGVSHLRDKRIDFSLNEWTGGGGMGVKFFLSPLFFVSPEVRIGPSSPIITTVRLGFVLGGR